MNFIAVGERRVELGGLAVGERGGRGLAGRAHGRLGDRADGGRGRHALK